MARLLLLLRHEVGLVRTAIPLHVVAIIQPSVMLLLIGWVFLEPTFELRVQQPTIPEGHALVDAMPGVGSPTVPYIEPVVVGESEGIGARQLVVVELNDGVPVAVQHFPLIDSNMVKNLRNRLTAALVRLWDEQLGDRAVRVTERPWLPVDLPFVLFFGMAALPMGAFISPAMTGAFLTARDFEQGTFLAYRLSPLARAPVLIARLLRLSLTGMLSVGAMVWVLAFLSGHWPCGSGWLVLLGVLVPMTVLGGCLGVTAGLLLRKAIPAFLVSLIATFGGWILGCAFGLRGSFGPVYEALSALTPNSWAVELLFPVYYGRVVGQPWLSVAVLALFLLLLLTVVSVAWARCSGERA